MDRPVKRPDETALEFANRLKEYATREQSIEKVKDLLLEVRIALKGKEHRAKKINQPVKTVKLSNRNKYIIAGMLVFLIITNPSLKAFKEYEGYSEYGGLSREYNFLLCSIYKEGNYTYFGICENFISI